MLVLNPLTLPKEFREAIATEQKLTIFAEYLFLWITSTQHGRKYLLDAAYGAGKTGLNLENIKSLSIGLPPFEEQEEIVRRVEDLFKFADQIEARYKQARSCTDKLTQSILAKAFRGELAPQDDADESASVLFERIKTAQTKDPLEVKSKRSKRSQPSVKN